MVYRCLIDVYTTFSLRNVADKMTIQRIYVVSVRQRIFVQFSLYFCIIYIHET